MSRLPRHGFELRTNRHEFGTDPAQTRARMAGIVDREGGGTAHPTLGGGYWAMAGAGAAEGDVGA